MEKKKALSIIAILSGILFIGLLVVGFVRLTVEPEPSDMAETLADAYMSSDEDFLEREAFDSSNMVVSNGNGASAFIVDGEVMLVGSYEGEFSIITFVYDTTFFDNSLELGYETYMGTHRDFIVSQESMWRSDNYIVVDMSEEEFIEGLKELTAQDIDYIASQIR